MKMKKRQFFVLLIALLTASIIVTTASGYENNADYNFVDEGFELIHLTFRLAGINPWLMDEETEYQRMLNNTFSEFSGHPAVQYIVSLDEQGIIFSSERVLALAIHLEKTEDGFSLVDDLRYLPIEAPGWTLWREEHFREFVELLNDFYEDTNFSEFFIENTEHYQDISTRFARELFYDINFEWFRQYGIDPGTLRIILSPSKSNLATASWLYEASTGTTFVYGGIPYSSRNFSRFRWLVVHEFAHGFSNPLAEEWYAQNYAFRALVDDTLSRREERLRAQGYADAIVVAYEYVTRAHTILYLVENTNANVWWLLFQETMLGFPNIEHVYAMVTDHTPMLHVWIAILILLFVLLIIVLPVFLVMGWRKRRKLKKIDM